MPKSKRTRTGCLCCRRRHKKCDEMKPSCKFCLSKNLVCEWPIKGSVFVNYQKEGNQTTTGQTSFMAMTPTNSTSTINTSNLSDTDSSRKSSIDGGNYKILSDLTLPPIKHYHMVIPRDNQQQQLSSKVRSPTKNFTPVFKELTFSTTTTTTTTTTDFKKDVPFNTSKRLSVDSLLN